MSEPTNKKLYNEVKAEADKKYKRHSLYKSGWITKTYQARGGKYKGKKSDKVGQWMREEWVEVEPYIKEGKKIKCGTTKGKGKACRPSKKIKDTPITIQEVIKKHSKKDILKVVKQKQKDMDKRINWKTLKIS
jgi:hypothetical protein